MMYLLNPLFWVARCLVSLPRLFLHSSHIRSVGNLQILIYFTSLRQWLQTQPIQFINNVFCGIFNKKSLDPTTTTSAQMKSIRLLLVFIVCFAGMCALTPSGKSRERMSTQLESLKIISSFLISSYLFPINSTNILYILQNIIYNFCDVTNGFVSSCCRMSPIQRRLRGKGI